MIDTRNRLSVMFHETDGDSYSSYDNEAADFLRDTFSLQFTPTGSDYLYIGFTKPFGALYADMSTANTETSSTLAAEYYDGATWSSLTVSDETNEFQRSGFLFWDRPSDWASVAVNSISKYWIRLRPSVASSVLVFNGINILFSDDHQLQAEFYEITNSNLIPAGQTTHITTHVASRNYIMQKLRNDGYIKLDSNNLYENITPWDLLDIFEVRQAATFLALSKIFFNLSDSPDDNWWTKYREYQDKFEESFRLAKLSIDYDDDGVIDNDEKAAPITVQRWGR